MVAQLIRLRWALFTNGLRRSVWQLVGIVIGALYMLGVLALVTAGLAALGLGMPEIAGPVAVVASALVVVGWAVIPVFFTGMDGSLDPQRFVQFPLQPRTLAVGLVAAGFIGVPGIATLLFMLATSLAYLRHPGALALCIVSALLSAVVAQLLARLGTAVAASLAERRGVRESATVLLFIPIMFLGPAIGGIAMAPDAVVDIVRGVAGWVRFTPFGAFAGLPFALSEGQWWQLGAGLLVGLATLVLAWWGYSVALQRAMHTPARVKEAAAVRGLGWIGRFPATPTGAVAGRALIYWFKDPRYAASIVAVPALVVLYVFVIPATSGRGEHGGGGADLAVILAPLVGALMGFAISADVSYDSTAFALHVLTGVRGTADRLGRVMALMCIALPLLAVSVVVPAAVSGSWERVPATAGVGLATLLTAAGLASISSARWTYAVPLPGESPFKTPQGSGVRMAATQGALFGSIVVCCLPVLVLYVFALVTGAPLLAWLTLVVGVAWGAAALWIGVRVGGRWLEQHEPDLMQAVMLNR